jgi:NAD(P)-dependent dehydrogenase (short-subunit alcohol dehydrogenase family)
MGTASKTIIITGGNSGLGYQCALDIAKTSKDYHIVIASRNTEKGELACKNISLQSGNENVTYHSLDLGSLDSIRTFSKEFSNLKLPPLYGIVCNAAANFSNNLNKSKDGIDLTFAVNHLGHFLLVNLLVAQITDGGRIVFVASDRHDPYKWMIQDFTYTDALHLAYPEKYLDKKKQNTNFKYPMSKLCNIYCSYELSKRVQEMNWDVTVNAFNPGYMPDTGLNGKISLFRKLLNNLTKLPAALLGTLSSVKKSGNLLALMMTDSKYDTITGKYFDRGKEIPSSAQSYDKEKSENLWSRSVELTNLQQCETILRR